MFKVPREWIEKWVTLKSGRRFPILKKEILLRLKKLRELPSVTFTPAPRLAQRFDEFGFEIPAVFEHYVLPSVKEVSEIKSTLRLIENTLRNTPAEDYLKQTELTFFHFSSKVPQAGSYFSYETFTQPDEYGKALLSDTLKQLTREQRSVLRAVFRLNPRNLYLEESNLTMDYVQAVQALFPEKKNIIALGLSPKGRTKDVGRVLAHEVGHLVQDTHFEGGPSLEEFRTVFARYLSRVADEGIRILKQEINTSSAYVRNFKDDVYDIYIWHYIDRKSSVITFRSIDRIEEAFSEAFCYYTLPHKREILQQRWPEAYDYFMQLFPGGNR